MVEYYESLPFVQKVLWEEGVPAITIETVREGKTRMMLNTASPINKEEVLSFCEVDYLRVQNSLRDGDCYFIFSDGGELEFGADETFNKLPEMIEILQSNEPKEKRWKRWRILQVMNIRGGGKN